MMLIGFAKYVDWLPFDLKLFAELLQNTHITSFDPLKEGKSFPLTKERHKN